MNLVFDIGNSHGGSLAVFSGGNLMWHAVCTLQNLQTAQQQFDIDRCAYCVTGTEDGLLPLWMRAKVAAHALRVTGTTPAPLRCAYRTSDTLGGDRWAAAVGAHGLFPDSHVLVIDAGTCVTFDLVDAEGVYHGGNIAPGLDMRLRAMHEHTARLPLVERGGALPDLGYDTETALRAGAVRGLAAEVVGYVTTLRIPYPELTILLTGGNAGDFPLPEDLAVCHDPHLVLRGLDAILRHKTAGQHV